MEIMEPVINILKKNGVDIDTFKRQESENENFSNLGVDSISYIKILVILEEEFGIEFDDEDLFPDRFTTLQSLVMYIENKIKK